MSPYLNTIVWTIGTVIFIIASSVGLGALARLIVRKRGANPTVQGRTFAGYMFAAPWIVGFFIFVAAPMVASLYWSFTQYHPPSAPEFTGLENYIRLITQDKDFRAALVNTLFLTVVGLPLQIIVALGLAVLLTQKLRGEKVYRAAFYLPVVLGLNAAALLCWRLMLNANNGIVNSVIRKASLLTGAAKRQLQPATHCRPGGLPRSRPCATLAPKPPVDQDFHRDDHGVELRHDDADLSRRPL